MCGFRVSSKILRGLDGIKSASLSVIFLTTLVCCTRGSSSSTIQSLTETGRLFGMREHLERTTDRSEDFNNEDVVLLGHSGDPWGSRNESKGSRNSQIQSSTLSATATRSSLIVGHSGHRRPKRSVAHLYNMVVCATGCNPISYKGYGCYCGFLGSGTAVDGIDQCCRMHDRCYDATECPTFLEYFVPYYWKCYRGYRPICAVEHGKWGGSGSCAQRLCECDRALSECLRRFPCPTSKAVCTTSPWRLIQNVFMIF